MMLSMIKKNIPAHTRETLRARFYQTIYQVIAPRFFPSYAQAGEDRILSSLFQTMAIPTPSYLDIGANHPAHCNNTYLFYERGSTGVCVEADPALYDELLKVRSRDRCLNVGITFDERKEADFYVFPIPAHNTLSKAEAEHRERIGSYKVAKVIKIPLKTINEIIEENFERTPDLISLDIEGIDLQVLKSLDFAKYRPLALCVETVAYSENAAGAKVTATSDFLVSQGYFVYADTYINTIFVDEKRFREAAVKTNAG